MSTIGRSATSSRTTWLHGPVLLEHEGELVSCERAHAVLYARGAVARGALRLDVCWAVQGRQWVRPCLGKKSRVLLY